ncbi:MAG: conserved membrane protein of unknown function [Promethearchaeota archaeon]|nr:MAG: conserved membrane protein of unknown function [Candidatus Lokiarchaeota archaeon]
MAKKTSTLVFKGILYVLGIVLFILIGVLLSDYITTSDEGIQSFIQENIEYFQVDVLLQVFTYIDSNFSEPVNSSLKLIAQSQYGNGFVLPSYLSYIPLACYVVAGVIGLFFIIFLINNIRTNKRRAKSDNIKFGSIYQTALLTTVFIFALVPLFSPIIDQGKNNQNFSIYNEEWNGCSTLKESIELMGYEVMPIQSSLSSTERLKQIGTQNLLGKSVLLVILGPNKFFNPIYEVPFFLEFFEGRNSLLLCHDHGSSYELLWEIFASNMIDSFDTLDFSSVNKTPVTIFADGYLRDNKSFDTNPLFPVITKSQFNDPSNIFTTGVDNVILSRASAAAGGPLIEFFGWDVVASASDVNSFVDKNFDGRYDYKIENQNLTYYIDSVDISFIFELMLDFYELQGEPIPDELLTFWNETDGELPLGYPFTPAVFLSKDTGDFRIFVSSDTSLWNNQLILNPKYDNLRFAMNVVNWLTRQDDGDLKQQWVVAIDEAHIRPETTNDFSSAGIFGFIMGYIIQLSTNPITAWIYPLLAVLLLRKFLPKKEKEEKKQVKKQEAKEERLRFRTSSFFAKKINRYHDKKKYRQALVLLYRRLERKLNTQLGTKPITPSNVIDLLKSKDPNVSKNTLKRVRRFIKFISLLKEGKKNVKDTYNFEQIYFEMSWINDKI